MCIFLKNNGGAHRNVTGLVFEYAVHFDTPYCFDAEGQFKNKMIKLR